MGRKCLSVDAAKLQTDYSPGLLAACVDLLNTRSADFVQLTVQPQWRLQQSF